MANYQNLLNSIASVIKTNGNKEITGAILQSTLQSIVSVMGANSTFAGVAVPATNPGTPDGSVFYLASTAGTYSNFGGAVLAANEFAILSWDTSSWTKTPFVYIADISEIEEAKDEAIAEIQAQSQLIANGAADFDFTIADENGYVIAGFQNGHIVTKNFNSADIDTTITFSLKDIDRILFIGSSQFESHFTLKGKDIIGRLGLMSDWNMESFSHSGKTFDYIINLINNGTAKYGASPQDYRSRYAVLCCFANDTKTRNVDEFKQELIHAIKVVRGMGIEPIVCSQYHERFMVSNVKTAYKDVANEYNCLYIDAAEFISVVRGKGDHTDFWNGSHMGTRVNDMQFYAYHQLLGQLERPDKGIKVFRKRDGYSITSIDELLYTDLWSRGEKWKEIYTGHSALNQSEEYVDSIASGVTNSEVKSEYLKMMNGSYVNFDTYAMVSVILPMYGNNTQYAGLKFKSNSNNLKVYSRNIIVPSGATYDGADFQVNLSDLSTPPSVGDTYNYDLANGITFTVTSVTSDSDYYTISTSASQSIVSNIEGGGELTKIQGDGQSTIPVLAVVLTSSGGVSPTSYGYWRELNQDEDGYYVLGDLHKYIDVDKVDFLVYCPDGTFGMASPVVSCSGIAGKNHVRNYLPSYNNVGSELLPNTTFGTIGVADVNWASSAGVNPTPIDVEHGYVKDSNNNYIDKGGVFPYGCSSCIVVDDANDIQFTYTNDLDLERNYDKELWLEITARYYPDVADPNDYDASTHNYIDDDSFDYNDLIVKLRLNDSTNECLDCDTGKPSEYSGTTDAYLTQTITKHIGTHWNIARIPIRMGIFNNTARINISSNTKGMQIARISLRQNLNK